MRNDIQFYNVGVYTFNQISICQIMVITKIMDRNKPGKREEKKNRIKFWTTAIFSL